MTAAGIIFSNIHDPSLPELTSRRTMGSVPFGCRYRLIDFPLSNMVNSGISKIGVIAHDNYQSLMDHIGTGKDWDLARRSGGIKLLPPFVSAYENGAPKQLYSTRLEALVGVKHFISKCNEDVIVLSDCDVICNIDLSDVLSQHEKTNADLTIVTCSVSVSDKRLSGEAYVVEGESDGVVKNVFAYDPRSHKVCEISTNIMVVDRIYLLSLIYDAISRGYSDLYRDIISRNAKKGGIFYYHCDSFALKIYSLESYFRASMMLLDKNIRDGLINVESRPIYTKVRNSPPTIYRSGCSVKNSYVADGCDIEGVVENSIIFRDVRIGKGSTIKNSVLLQGDYVGEGVLLNCVVADKDVVIKSGRTLCGHTSIPFFISKGGVV